MLTIPRTNQRLITSIKCHLRILSFNSLLKVHRILIQSLEVTYNFYNSWVTSRLLSKIIKLKLILIIECKPLHSFFLSKRHNFRKLSSLLITFLHRLKCNLTVICNNRIEHMIIFILIVKPLSTSIESP